MESVKAFKFMNGWIIKHKDIDKIEEAIWVNRTLTLESLYVYMYEYMYMSIYEYANVYIYRH